MKDGRGEGGGRAGVLREGRKAAQCLGERKIEGRDLLGERNNGGLARC